MSSAIPISIDVAIPLGLVVAFHLCCNAKAMVDSMELKAKKDGDGDGDRERGERGVRVLLPQ